MLSLRIYNFNINQRDASALEEEIQQIERDIIFAEREIQVQNDEQDYLRSVSHSLTSQNTFKRQLCEKRTSAKRNLGKLKSIEGVVGWRVKQIEESMISVEARDSNIPGLCIFVDFEEQTAIMSGKVVCRAQVRSTNKDYVAGRSGYSTKINSEYSSSALNYIEHSMSATCKEISSRILDSSSDMFRVLNHVEWYLGRLALIGKELTVLERLHMGTLKRNIGVKGFSSHLLNLTVKTREDKEVAASFEICESYPFAVLDVNISFLDEASLDMKLLERQLRKTSKPGFGYLSRTCDVIASFQS